MPIEHWSLPVYTGCMYVGVDIGGTKTLVAVLDEHGRIQHSVKFPTPKDYDHFLLELRHVAHHLPEHDFLAGGVGMPVTVFDRKHGRGLSFGNLPWRNVPIQHDVERIFHCPIVIENDAKLAALSEAMLLKHDYHTVLYVTVSTGIGYGLVVDGQIDTSIGDSGGKGLLLEHKHKFVPWESFASGHAIVERYGKLAKDITSETTWRAIARDLAKGLIELIAMAEPEAIIIGGGVGSYFDRYGHLLEQEIARYHIPLIKLPVLLQARRPEEAVVYGCYDLAKQTYGSQNASVKHFVDSSEASNNYGQEGHPTRATAHR
jgi:predicted NBD/HSP70 family sugar kinase